MRWFRSVVSAALIVGLTAGFSFLAVGCSGESQSTAGQVDQIPDTQKAMMDYMQTKSQTAKKHR
jgi:hypothetical protein